MDSVKFKLGKTSKFQILNILFWTMDLKFLESVIIDYLIWVESYTVYVVWIHNIARQAKKILLRVWKDMKSIKLHVKVLHLIRSSQIEYKVMKVRKLYGLCGVDSQYCPPGKENFVKSLKRYEIN